MTSQTVGHEHDWKYDGRPFCTAEIAFKVGCENPHNIRCAVPACREQRLVRCGSASARVCRSCSLRSKTRVQRVAGSGVVVGVDGLFLTVTAPSWKRHYLPDGRECRCTGGLGDESLAHWNALAGKRFNRLMRDLERILTRCYGCLKRGRKRRLCEACGPDVKLVYFKGAETQRRGALHFHWLVRRADGVPLRVKTGTFRRLALRHGFGHSVDVTSIKDHHAGYVAKYASKAASERSDVPWDGWVRTERIHDEVTGEILPAPVKGRRHTTRPSYRTWSKSRAWGDSMRVVRARQAHHEAVLEVLPAWVGGVAPVEAYSDVARFRPVEDRPAKPPE